MALKLLNADGFWHMSTSEAAKVEIAGGPDRAKKHAERPQLQLVRKVEVELVFDPPWDPSRMSDEAKLQLNMF